MQMFKSSESRGQKVRLARMPQPSSERSLPDAKTWEQRYDGQLRSWAGAQSEVFDEALDLYILTRPPRELQEFDRENRMLPIRDMQPVGRQVTPRCPIIRQTWRCTTLEDHPEYCRQDRGLARTFLPNPRAASRKRV